MGQLEVSRWYFGNGAGLSFNEGCALPLNDSAINTIESSSVISTLTGDLLFYSDGLNIYNRNHVIMDNGDNIFGALSSTNGALIIPDPSNLLRYYLFTADAIQNYQANGQGTGVNYSIVDMSAGGGLGAVVEKNTNLLTEGSEKLTAVQSDDGYWLLTHFEGRFYAYPVTASGIGGAVVTNIGPDIDDFNNIRGSIKFSPDGSKVAICHSYFEPNLSGQLFLYDFDINSGVLSNQLMLGDDVVYYGVEFSPNSQVLYTTGKVPINGGDDTGNSKLFQFDLQAGEITSTRLELADYLSSPFVNLAGLLQLGIDGKLYHSLGGGSLSVILLPNRVGEGCNFLFRSVSLGVNSSSIGLPIGNQEYYRNIIEYEDLCNDDATSFFLNSPAAISSVSWNFGDPGSGVENSSTSLQATHTFSEVGSFTVTAQVTYFNGESEEFSIIVKNVIAPLLTPATLFQCDIDGIPDGRTPFNLLDALDVIFIQDVNDIAGLNLRFFETEDDALLSQNQIETPANYINQFDGQIIYASVSQSLDCVRITEVTLSVDTGEPLEDLQVAVCASSLGENSAVVSISSIIDAIEVTYPNVLIRLYESIEFAGLQTNQREGSALFEFGTPNVLYYRLGEPDECIGIGPVSITIEEPLMIENKDLVICFAEDGAILEGPAGFESYEWSSGEITENIQITEPGLYVVQVSLFVGCDGTASYRVEQGPELMAAVIVEDFKQNNKIIIEATIALGEIFYSIDGGETFSTSNIFSNVAPGMYTVVVRDEAACNEIITDVVVRGAPRYFTPNNDGINDRWHVQDVENYEGMQIDIYDRYGKHITSLSDRSPGWDGTYNGKPQATNTYWYSINYEGETSYGYFTLIVRNL